jgi:hypothetical protein
MMSANNSKSAQRVALATYIPRQAFDKSSNILSNTNKSLARVHVIVSYIVGFAQRRKMSASRMVDTWGGVLVYEGHVTYIIFLYSDLT